MIDQPRIITTEAEQIAVIHVTVPEEEIRNVMGPTLQELLSTVAQQGVKPSGPWLPIICGVRLIRSISKWAYRCQEQSLPQAVSGRANGRR